MVINKDAAVIEPRKGKREDALPASAILVFTPKDLELFLHSLPLHSKRSQSIYLADIYVCSHQNVPFALVGPMLGAPQAVLILEKLIALGVKNVLAVGWCGSLQSHVRIGDVVLPTGALSEEGTSAHYPISPGQPGPSEELLNPLREALRADSMRIHEGKVWSTDAPFRETVGKVMTYQEQGIQAVEMEASALFTVARFRGIRLAMALVVSDDLSSLKWIHGFREVIFQESRKRMASLAIRALCSTECGLSSQAQRERGDGR